LEDVSLSEAESKDVTNKKNIIWQKLHSIYKDETIATWTLTQAVKPDKAAIVYPSLQERCSINARHSITNRILNQISFGKQIPPFRLMSCIDAALKTLSTAEGQRMCEQRRLELLHILPDLQKDDSFVFGLNEEKEDNE